MLRETFPLLYLKVCSASVVGLDALSKASVKRT